MIHGLTFVDLGLAFLAAASSRLGVVDAEFVVRHSSEIFQNSQIRSLFFFLSKRHGTLTKTCDDFEVFYVNKIFGVKIEVHSPGIELMTF